MITKSVGLLLLASISLLRAADNDFKPIFNGKDLTGWDGDTRLWTVRDGVIRGETALPDRMTLHNTFLIWRGGKLADFEMTLQFRIQSGNSGVQYRSKDLGKWVVSGYQAEVEDTPGKVGFLYEEKGRKYLANVGEKVEVGADGKRRVIEQFTTKQALITSGYYKSKDWNEYHIIAQGNRLEQRLNGVKTIELIDLDEKNRALEGILALQIHAGTPMVVEFKDIRLKNL